MPKWALSSKSGQWNYMGEVSRLLIASSRLRPMETFFLILFSSLMGIDASYFLLLFFIILFFIIVHQMVTTVSCVDTGVLIWIGILIFIMVTLINSFLARILSSLSDRMHSIHPHGVVVFSPLLSAFNLINNNGVIFTMESSSQWCHLQK